MRKCIVCRRINIHTQDGCNITASQRKKAHKNNAIAHTHTHKTERCLLKVIRIKNAAFIVHNVFPYPSINLLIFFPLFLCKKKSQRINVLRFFKKYLNISWSNEWAALNRIELKNRARVKKKEANGRDTEWQTIILHAKWKIWSQTQKMDKVFGFIFSLRPIIS